MATLVVFTAGSAWKSVPHKFPAVADERGTLAPLEDFEDPLRERWHSYV